MTKPHDTGNIKRALGLRVRALRKVRGMSQQDMADVCRVHWTYIGGLERGERNPTLLTLQRISDGLRVSIRALISPAETEELGVTAREKKEGLILKWLKKGDDPTLELATRMVRELSIWQDRYGKKA